MTLKELRKANRFTQKEAAKIVGVSVRTYVTYETKEEEADGLKLARMKEILSERTAERFVTLGTDLFGFDPALPAMEMAEKVIDAFYAFFEETGIPMHLGALGVTADKIDEMADHILTFDSTNEPWMYAPLDKAALLRILNASM